MPNMLNNCHGADQSKSKKRKRQKANKILGGVIESDVDKKKARQESKIKKLTAELLLMNDSSKADSCLQTLIAIKENGLANNGEEGYGTTISKLSSAIKDMPTITLQATGVTAQLAIPDQQRQPLLLSDIRAMLQASFLPMAVGLDHSNWCQVRRRTSQLIVVVVEGVSLATFSDLSLSRTKVNKYYQQLLLGRRSSTDVVGNAYDQANPDALDTSSVDNDNASPQRKKTKKMEKCLNVSASNLLASEDLSFKAKSTTLIENQYNNSLMNTKSHSSCHRDLSNSKLPASGHSDLYNTVSAWLPGCCSRYSRALELAAPGRYGRHLAQNLLLIRFSRKRIQRVKEGLEKSPATLVEQASEEALYRQQVGEQAMNSNVSPPEETLHCDTHEVIHERFGITTEVSLPLDPIHWGRANEKETRVKNVFKDDNFDRRQLLVSFPDLFTERYPLPEHLYYTYRNLYIPAHRVTSTYAELCYKNCVATKQVYAKVRSVSPLFGLDCEFVFTTGRVCSLGSISLVSEAGELLYHTLVKPRETIIDYATRWSGLTEKMLRNVTTTLTDVQEHLKRHLPQDAILVGHSLATDLKVMQMYHPYVVDTSLLYNLSGFKANRSKLKTLSKNFLQKDIQMVKRMGHDPTEDAEAALQLVQLKLQHDYNFGNVIRNGSMPSLSNPTQRCLPSHEKYFNMFESLEEYWEQSRQLPTNKPVRDQYVVLCPTSLSTQWDRSLRGLTKPAAPQVMEDNNAVIDAVCDTAMINDVTIAHLEADPRLMSSKVKPRLAALSVLDDQLTRVFDAAANKALCCVIFAGAPPGDFEGGTKDASNPVKDKLQNGMVFFEIKGAPSRVMKAAVRRLPTDAADGKS